MKIYNLFPLLAGNCGQWPQHLARARDLGFDWVYINPIQQSGQSKSLYSIADYFAIDERFAQGSDQAGQIRSIIEQAKTEHGLKFMMDLVINHCAVDSPLLKQHPDWFVRDAHNNVVNPSCMEDGQQVVWQDLALFNHQHSPDADGLYRFLKKVVEFCLDLGVDGFRCDAAYQLPPDLWRRLINDTRAKHPDAVFTAETLGCSPEQTRATAEAGFDYVFNSGKWWDFSSPWYLEQYQLIRHIAPSIAFPESHDTPRLFAESHGNLGILKQRYLFSALFSAGVLMPMGFEYGADKSLHVVNSRPEDWQTDNADLTDFIRYCHTIKDSYRVFQEDGPINLIQDFQSPILFLWKASNDGRQEALLLLNKDPHNWQTFHDDDLYRFVQSRQSMRDVSYDYPLAFVPTPFHFELEPGSARVLVVGE
ncbi:MAG: alpha-amylase family glycosyl hydrolase [Methylococcales bacterium]|nr:alpha-amylase family glycosyl hydrolase [Methylococcales bacterium]